MWVENSQPKDCTDGSPIKTQAAFLTLELSFIVLVLSLIHAPTQEGKQYFRGEGRYCIVQAGLKVTILLLQPPESWGYRNVPLNSLL